MGSDDVSVEGGVQWVTVPWAALNFNAAPDSNVLDMGSEPRPSPNSGKKANKRFLAQPPGLGLGDTQAPSVHSAKGGDAMETDRTLHGHLTDDLIRQTGVLEDSMLMDDDGSSGRAYGTDYLTFDDTDGGQARNRSTSSQISGEDVLMEDLVTHKISASDTSHSEGLMTSY